ncbi:hydantoinase/oxoprolinase family protein [Pseudonocardia sp. NPDC046786]|uniref:hydantoinase/oxoprolinase family protein n=1 Tax=Pseudonocardia sp. NPDC046786 TaxID=3155471 RepID=UPI0033DD233D
MVDAPTRGAWWFGIDVGGTFTDVVGVNRETGETREHKVLTTKPDLEQGVIAALRETGIPIEEVGEIVHGHTSGINAVLSRTGARVALLATAGHRDLLDIGRQDRQFGPEFYDPSWLRPHQARPIVKRQDRYGITERVGWDGTQVLPLDENQIRTAARELREKGIDAVAVCFLNSYITQEHEQRAADIVREEFPEAYVQTSALYPVTKEHERTATVALDAYVGPIVTRYLQRLVEGLDKTGYTGSLWIMTMNGGIGTVTETSKAPVFQLVSGPVGGVNGAVHLARTSNNPNLLTMDVGGTSTDIAVVQNGEPPMTDLWSIENGLTMTMPVLDIHSVGSGAGSIIHIDAVGNLRVGPQSAGSTPGPACYGRGGTQPTLTDACVALGILQPDLFAGGALTLNVDLARQALATVADKLGMGVDELADAAYRLACSDIAGSIRSISTYRGLDVRDFGLLAFGAAGPMVADRVARELGARKVLVPSSPGEFSAFGLLTSDLRVTRARSPLTTLNDHDPHALEAAYAEMERDIIEDLGRQGVSAESVEFERAFFAMYRGQTWDNRLPLQSGTIDSETIETMLRQVHDLYEHRYGFSAEEIPVLVTTLEVTGVSRRPEMASFHASTAETSTDPQRRVALRLAGVEHPDSPVYTRVQLAGGMSVNGPAIIVEAYATTVVNAGSTASVTDTGELLLTLDED